MTHKKKELWFQRRDCLRSLSLEKIAAEVNEKRWKAYLCILSAPTEAQRKKMRALIRRYEAGQLTELPSDLRADGQRMRRTLVALHGLIRGFGGGVYKHEQIAAEAEFSKETSERAIRDLVDADLIIADRERERPRRHGGQGPSRYQIVWSTLIDLGVAQGIQFTLTFAELTQDLTEEKGRPPASMPATQDCRPQFAPGVGRPPARSAQFPSEPAARKIPHGEEAPPHHEEAPPHHEEAPPHKSAPNARAGAPVLPSQQSSSPSAPFESQLHTPSAEQPDSSATQKEKKNSAQQNDWPAAVTRVERYGVLLPSRAVDAARARGWSVEQVHELLAACEARVVGQVKAWGEGLVFRHLQTCPAGAPIALPPSEAYVRAARDRDLELDQVRQATREAAAAAQLAESMGANEHLDVVVGPVLEALSDADRDELARATLNPFELKFYRKHGCRGVAIRYRLLRELERRAAQEASS